MAMLLPTAMRAWQPVGTATDTLPQTVGNGVTGIGDQTVKVTLTGWPDSVFGTDYRLRSLSETEAYIREHGHLPDVPSATEVEEGGLSLGEMNKVLLQKVEELTLHVIELQKQIDELKSNNEK